MHTTHYCSVNYWWRAWFIPVDSLKAYKIAKMPSYPQLCPIKRNCLAIVLISLNWYYLLMDVTKFLDGIKCLKTKKKLWVNKRPSEMISETVHHKCTVKLLEIAMRKKNCNVRVHRLISIESINEYFVRLSPFLAQVKFTESNTNIKEYVFSKRFTCVVCSVVCVCFFCGMHFRYRHQSLWSHRQI